MENTKIVAGAIGLTLAIGALIFAWTHFSMWLLGKDAWGIVLSLAGPIVGMLLIAVVADLKRSA